MKFWDIEGCRDGHELTQGLDREWEKASVDCEYGGSLSSYLGRLLELLVQRRGTDWMGGKSSGSRRCL